jgi:hypothetical protein
MFVCVCVCVCVSVGGVGGSFSTSFESVAEKSLDTLSVNFEFAPLCKYVYKWRQAVTPAF